MNIVCPQCQFARDVPEDRLPAATVVATCPRCQHKFKVERPLAPVVEVEDAVHSAHEGDDPLPPGARVPKSEPMGPEEPEKSEKTSPPPNASRASRPDNTPAKDDPEHDEDYRKAALAAYQRQAHAQDTFALDNPWEYSRRDGYFAAFYQTVMRVMFAAPRFFSGLKADTPQRFALFFYTIVTVLQIVVERFWGDILASMLADNTAVDPQLQQLVSLLRPQIDIFMALILRTGVGLLELFLAAGLYYLMFRLVAADRANYTLIFQVIAYSAAPSLLCVVPVAGSVAGLGWSIACGFVGCRYALGLTWGQTATALVPIYLVGVPFVLQLVRSVQSLAG